MSTDIDGTPILMLRPEQALFIVSLSCRAAPLSAGEKALVDRATQFCAEAPQHYGPSFDELMRQPLIPLASQ
jgi:hypothetical protein